MLTNSTLSALDSRPKLHTTALARFRTLRKEPRAFLGEDPTEQNTTGTLPSAMPEKIRVCVKTMLCTCGRSSRKTE
jgi:hypothetical protein